MSVKCPSIACERDAILQLGNDGEYRLLCGDHRWLVVQDRQQIQYCPNCDAMTEHHAGTCNRCENVYKEAPPLP